MSFQLAPAVNASTAATSPPRTRFDPAVLRFPLSGRPGTRHTLAARWRSDGSGTIRARVVEDSTGGHFGVAEQRVLAGGRVLARNDGRVPLKVRSGQTFEVLVEYDELALAADRPPQEARVVVEGRSAGASPKSAPRFIVTIPVSAGERRAVLLVVDGFQQGGTHCTYAPGRVLADTGQKGAGSWFNVAHLLRVFEQRLSGYRIVKAHRDLDPGDFASVAANERALFRPDHERFRFDAVDLSTFDQIWLIGIGSPPHTPPLTDNEVIALARFMDGGGGVFATGDHEDLGGPMCGRVPRVRSMRKWWFQLSGPDNEPRAPGAFAPTRIDTTQPGKGATLASADYRFDFQSDDIPQPISATPAGAVHPLLALANGRRLSVLPDHMHEGEVIDPFDGTYTFSPTVSFTTDGGERVTFAEYPKRVDGTQPRPQVLATGAVLPGHTTLSTEPNHAGADKPTVSVDNVGMIGAYDGHPVGLGRVVVQSTFHHLVDVNLTGDIWAIHADGTVDEEKRLGFLASASGRAHLDDIEAYLVNVVRWLSRP